jgi:hypothetical protein
VPETDDINALLTDLAATGAGNPMVAPYVAHAAKATLGNPDKEVKVAFLKRLLCVGGLQEDMRTRIWHLASS